MSGRRDIRATINGVVYERAIEPRLLLADFLRHTLGLTGTHVGCEHGSAAPARCWSTAIVCAHA